MHQWKNSVNRFGVVARGFHWGIAFIILGMLILGFNMTAMAFSPFKLELYGYHKSFGMIVLAAGVLRILWRVVSLTPSALPSHASWETILSQIIHIVLYVSIIGMPLSGWLMSSAGEYPNSFFGLFEFPHLVGKDEALYEWMKWAHAVFAYTLIGCIGLHILGALKHHIIDRDETLKRMGGRVVFGVVGLLVLVYVSSFVVRDVISRTSMQKIEVPVVSEVDAQVDRDLGQAWIIDYPQSEIEFSYTQYGQSISGRFVEWLGVIDFDVADLGSSSVRVEIDIGSVVTGSADRDEQARGAQWFDVVEHPRAVFESKAFEALGEDRYQVNGVLDLRGVRMPVSFSFTLNISDEGVADMRGELILKRLDFGIGQGEWARTDGIADAVEIEIIVRAQQ